MTSLAGAEGAAVVKPTPKKDTVRIEVPPAGRAAAPQATVKLQQTQPLIRPPAAEVRTIATTTAPITTRAASDEVEVENDPMLLYASVAVLIFAVVTFALQVMTYIAT